jgi:hypothetical protein
MSNTLAIYEKNYRLYYYFKFITKFTKLHKFQDIIGQKFFK